MKPNWKGEPRGKRKASSAAATPIETSSKYQDFEDAVEKMKVKFQDDQVQRLKESEDRIVAIDEELKAIDPEKHYMILQRKILLDEKKTLQGRVDDIISGASDREFQKKIREFIAAKESIEKSPSCIRRPHNRKKTKGVKGGDDGVPDSEKNRRKATGHSRQIRVSTSKSEWKGIDLLYDELIDTMGDPEDAESSVYVHTSNMCSECNVLCQRLSAESVLSCPQCGIIYPYLDSTVASTGHSDDRSFSQFAYSRKNHFETFLKTIQGKESAQIPEPVKRGVEIELAKKRIRPEHVTPKKVRDALKVMKQSKYYEHSVLITSHITGIPPPRFTPVVEQKLVELFLKIQAPFGLAVKAVDPTRKNFLSYGYIALKLCQILGDDAVDKEWISRMPRLKGRDKLYKSDLIWQHICQQLGWRYYPTV